MRAVGDIAGSTLDAGCPEEAIVCGVQLRVLFSSSEDVQSTVRQTESSPDEVGREIPVIDFASRSKVIEESEKVDVRAPGQHCIGSSAEGRRAGQVRIHLGWHFNRGKRY